MKLRKITCAAMAAVMAAATLAGCSGGNTTDTTTTAAGSTAGTEAEGTVAESGSGEKVTIEYWHTNSETRGGAAVQSIVDAFNAANPDIEVITRYNDGYDGLMQNLQADVAAGKTPDIVQVSYSNIEYFPNNFAYVAPDELMKDYSDTPDFVTDNFAENIISLGSDNQGNLVGFPYAVSNPILYYNKDIFEEAGLTEAPETWEELREAAMTIKEKTGKNAFHLQENDTWALQALLECNGGKMLTWTDGVPTCTLADPKNEEAFQFYADMTLVDGTSIHISTDEAIQAFNAGELGMLASSCANLSGIEDSAQFEIGTAPFPVFEGEKRAVPAGGCVLAVMSQDDAKKEACAKFIQYLYEDDNIVEWIAGTGYVAPTISSNECQGMKDLLASDPLMEAAASQVGDIVPWAAYPGDSGLQAQQYISDARDQILGGEDVNTALTEAQDRINALFD